MICERCGKGVRGYELFDYCTSCSKNLCPDCMAKGCCGHVPARGGMADYDSTDTAGQDGSQGR
jgi:hypothetical protein